MVILTHKINTLITITTFRKKRGRKINKEGLHTGTEEVLASRKERAFLSHIMLFNEIYLFSPKLK